MQSKSNIDRTKGFLTRLNGETPRSRILLESGYLEELLRAAILNRLAQNSSAKELFGPDSSMGLGLLAKYAHALGLIVDSELSALKKFSKVRNKIAHSWSADFNDPDLQNIASTIQFIGIKGENDLPAHQRCFARLDYLGLFLTEEFINRFSMVPSISYINATFLKSFIVDPETGQRENRTTIP
jgi:hypothetical protein